jgi:hypothetical protein
VEVDMPLLEVADCPEDVFESISMAAKRENKSIAQETVQLVMDGLMSRNANQQRRRAVLAEIAAKKVPEAAKAVDVVALIREDRDR